MGHFLLFLFSIWTIFRDTVCEECRETSLTSAPRSFSCPGGCCGEIYQRYCCSSNGTLSIEAIIAGISVAAVVLVGIIVGAIVYLCKKQSHRRVVYPNNEVNRTSTGGMGRYNNNASQGTDYYHMDSSLHPSYSDPIKPGYGAHP